MPYPGHPNGCPNFGKRAECPPKAPHIETILDLAKPIDAVWVRFNLAEHAARLRAKHPNWSERQTRCCLYWQPLVRKQLRAAIAEHALAHGLPTDLIALAIPEACGVDLTRTMAQIGIHLEWPPIEWVYKIAIVGTAQLSLFGGEGEGKR
jgi:hypothetical protein